MSRYTILWLSVNEWDAAWDCQQILAHRLAAEGHAVTFVETLGVRSATRRDWRRLVGRLRKRLQAGLRGFRPLARNLWLFSPVLLPVPGRPWADSINQRLLMFSFRRLPMPEPGAPLMVWTYLPTPLAVRLVKRLQPTRWVYYAIDDVAHNPAGVAPGLAQAEAWLASHADQVFTTSQELFARQRVRNPNTTYLPGAVDIAPFVEPRPEPADLASLPHPRICFFGTLDLRVDQDLLARVATAHPDSAVVLLGPVKCDVGRLRELANVYLLGARSHDLLPAYLQHMDLFVIPYKITPYTVSIHPVKTYEALATGKPLVTTDLPELRPLAGAISVTEDQDAFVAAVGRGLAEADPALSQRRREIARQNTWDARYRVIKEKLPGLA